MCLIIFGQDLSTAACVPLQLAHLKGPAFGSTLQDLWSWFPEQRRQVGCVFLQALDVPKALAIETLIWSFLENPLRDWLHYASEYLNFAFR